jgi:uncharacterized membrane protein
MATVATLFDPRTVMLAKHAQHVVLVHFPIALTITAIGFEWVAAWRPGAFGAALADAAYWNLTAAAATAVAAVATGIAAWRWQLEGVPLRGTLLLHAVFGGASAGAIVVLWWLCARRRRRPAGAPGLLYLALTVFVFAMVAATGHLGGFVSGVNVP